MNIGRDGILRILQKSYCSLERGFIWFDREKLDAVRRGHWQILDNPTQQGIVGDVVLVAERPSRGEDADVELLAQVPVLCEL